MLNDIEKQRIKRIVRPVYEKRDLMMDCAEDFGRLIAYAEKEGLTVPQAFEAAREHFRLFGAAMIEFSKLVTIEMVPEFKDRK